MIKKVIFPTKITSKKVKLQNHVRSRIYFKFWRNGKKQNSSWSHLI